MRHCRNEATEQVLHRSAGHPGARRLLGGVWRGARAMLSQVGASGSADPLLSLDARLLSDIGIEEDWHSPPPAAPRLAALSNRVGGVPFGCQASP